ncbi:HBL/NHE enterotoxin family protein [Shouchella lonarensis]|uniref:Non-hemolytic enterotoxin B/C n=1 Tax=Shouchella lonarensis TaxID=1464122 RepID=A0A1G6J653_9BACI|nr:HBL/NHE enterotoxin family protein [Shouchella lonarensis]SDC14334.1 non-hemolytic enterotoxin B/C [Shouchella lonarensis]
MNKKIKTLTCLTVMTAMLTTTVVPATHAFAATNAVPTEQAVSAEDELVPAELENVLAKTGSHIAVLDEYAILVNAQAPYDFSATSIDKGLIDKIVADQQTAKANAIKWVDQVKPQIIQTNEDIFAFGTKFDKYYETLVRAADEADTSKLKSGITSLYKSIQNKQNDVTDLIGVLKTYRNAVVDDGENFSTNATNVAKAFDANTGKIEQLQDLIAEYQKNIDEGTDLVTEGVSYEAPGIVLMVLGKVLVFLGNTTGISMDLAGMGLTADGAALVTNGIQMIKSGKDGIRDATAQLSQAEGQVAALSLNKERLQTFTKEIDVAIQSAQAVLNQWQLMGAKYETLLEKIDRATPEDLLFIKAQLKSAKKSWEDILAYADNLYVDLTTGE